MFILEKSCQSGCYWAVVVQRYDKCWQKSEISSVSGLAQVLLDQELPREAELCGWILEQTQFCGH